MNRWIRLAAWLIPAVAFVHACGGNAATDSTSGNTNWLKFCDRQADCGEGLSCQCNSCQQTCAESADCTIADPGSRCAMPSEGMQCDEAPAGVRLCVKNCDVSSDCERNDLTCDNGSCVPTSLPSGDAGSVNDPDAAPVSEDAGGSAIDTPPDASQQTDTGGGALQLPENDPPPGMRLISGEGYGLARTADPNVLFDVTATFNGDGNMTGFEYSAGESLSIGNATLQGAGSDGVVAWGVWVGGPGRGTISQTWDDPYFGDMGFHYAVGKIVTTLPTGVVTYVLVGASPPLFEGASQPGVVDYATIVIDYDLGRVGMESSLTTSEGTMVFETTGGLADVSNSGGILNNNLFKIDNVNSEEELDPTATRTLLDGVIVQDGLVLSYNQYVSELVTPDPRPDGGTTPPYYRAIASAYGTMAFRRE